MRISSYRLGDVVVTTVTLQGYQLLIHHDRLILEHRFYGESFPVTNLSTDSMKTLTTLQSLKDSANLASNLVFPGRLSKLNLTASNTAWIYYGGSYAGAKAAFARKLFPDVFWGAIASSAVTTAIVPFWQYYEVSHIVSALSLPALTLSRWDRRVISPPADNSTSHESQSDDQLQQNASNRSSTTPQRLTRF